MTNIRNPKSNPNQPRIYEIRVEGHLGQQWTDWFEGLTITRETNGDTLITGLVADQAALYGLLKKVRDLGLPLFSVNCRDINPPVSPQNTDQMQTTNGSQS